MIHEILAIKRIIHFWLQKSNTFSISNYLNDVLPINDKLLIAKKMYLFENNNK